MGLFSSVTHSITHAFNSAVHGLEHLTTDIYHGLLHVTDLILDPIFGSKKTITDLEFTKLYQDVNDLYQRKLLSSYVIYDKDVKKMFLKLITEKNTFLMSKQLEALGLASVIDAKIEGISNENIEAYLEAKGYCKEPTIVRYTTRNAYMLKLYDWIAKNITDIKYEYSIIITESIPGFISMLYSITFNPININGEYYIPKYFTSNYSDNLYLDHDEYNYNFYKVSVIGEQDYTYSKDDDKTFVIDNKDCYSVESVYINDTECTDYTSTVGSDGYTTVTVNCTLNDNDTVKITYKYIDMNQTDVYITKYIYNGRETFVCEYKCNDDGSDPDYEYIVFGFTDELESFLSNEKFLFIPMKHDSSLIPSTRQQKIFFKNIGIKKDEISDSLSQSEISESFISVFSTRDDILFNDIFDVIYGTVDNKKTVTIENNGVKIQYLWNDDKNVLNLNGVPKDAEHYLIPVRSLRILSIKDYWDRYSNGLMVVTYSSKTVEMHWYSSKEFRSFAAFVAFATGNIELGVMLLASNYLDVVLNSFGLSDRDKQYLKILYDVATIYYGGGSIYSDISNVASLTNDLATLYFQIKQGEIINDINRYNKQYLKNQREIEKLRKKGMYAPLDYIQSYYDNQFDMLYNYYDNYYNTSSYPII